MGTGSSKSPYLGTSPSESDTASFEDSVGPRWSLPPPSQDEVWLKVNLALLVNTSAGLTSKCGSNVKRASSERRAEAITRNNQPARAQHSVRSFECSATEDDDWLEASVCLSMAFLQEEDMALVVSSAKKTLQRTLSSLCRNEDVFSESLMQRVHALFCVHAAMTRQRRMQLDKGSEDTGTHRKERRAVQRADHAGVVEEELGSHKMSDHLLGLQLFFSFMDYVREPECEQEQVMDFLRQIEPVLTSLPPLCLAGEYSDSIEVNAFNQRASMPAPSVVHSLRDFLVTLALAGIDGKCNLREEGEKCNSTGTAGTYDSAQRELVLSALISVGVARGLASDLLVLVKVLLSSVPSFKAVVKTPQHQSEASDVLAESGAIEEHLTSECSAKR